MKIPSLDVNVPVKYKNSTRKYLCENVTLIKWEKFHLQNTMSEDPFVDCYFEKKKYLIQQHLFVGRFLYKTKLNVGTVGSKNALVWVRKRGELQFIITRNVTTFWYISSGFINWFFIGYRVEFVFYVVGFRLSFVLVGK